MLVLGIRASGNGAAQADSVRRQYGQVFESRMQLIRTWQKDLFMTNTNIIPIVHHHDERHWRNARKTCWSQILSEDSVQHGSRLSTVCHSVVKTCKP